MGKKYIIELRDDCPNEFKGIIVFGLTPDGHISIEPITVEDLTPYTEPDLEQVRIEAYEDGYKTAKVQCNIQAEKDMREVGERHYQRGLADAKCGYDNGFENGMIVAWDAAKKIALMDTETSENVTGYFGLFRIMENLTPMQAIEKIRQYEQEKEEIQVGDEIETPSGLKGYAVNFTDDELVHYVSSEGRFGTMGMSAVSKTGRHFPEIAAVLEKMKES